ncbi:RimJ/RimL family protein N-acetyltransferase [Paenibacillus silagei]|uniref:RimJ/RimL family protein N-acetyltransferase n=1 Tax=Paenibacillus silagei TaxID=1670801 RepID=A0ABS4NKS6_9BACL|nr:RimJ/RimL family protein N-acetyltransferase [Paenibacillus silagei]
MPLRYLLIKGLHKIVLDTNLKNVRAWHVYKKHGFRKNAVQKNVWIDHDGVRFY